MNDILEGRLIYRIPKERMSASLDLYEMRAFKKFHGRWPLRSELEDAPEPLPAPTVSSHGEGAPAPPQEEEIVSESDTGASRGIEEIDDWAVGNYNKETSRGRVWMRQCFGKCPSLIAKFDEVDRSEATKTIWVLWDVSPFHLKKIAAGFFPSLERAEEGKQVLLRRGADIYTDAYLEITEETLDAIHR